MGGALFSGVDCWGGARRGGGGTSGASRREKNVFGSVVLGEWAAEGGGRAQGRRAHQQRERAGALFGSFLDPSALILWGLFVDLDAWMGLWLDCGAALRRGRGGGRLGPPCSPPSPSVLNFRDCLIQGAREEMGGGGWKEAGRASHEKKTPAYTAKCMMQKQYHDRHTDQTSPPNQKTINNNNTNITNTANRQPQTPPNTITPTHTHHQHHQPTTQTKPTRPNIKSQQPNPNRPSSAPTRSRTRRAAATRTGLRRSSPTQRRGSAAASTRTSSCAR